MVLAEDLRQAVLQAALQGKLAEQLDTDSNVDEMLISIQEEKERFIAEKKIKKEKPLPEIQEDESPFEIPDNWRWVKTGNICDCGAGATPPRTEKSYYDNGVIPWLKTGELTDGYIYKCEERVTQLALDKCSLRVNQKNDILIAMYGATIGKLGIVTFPLTTNQACCGCTPYKGIYNLYLFYCFMSLKKILIGKAEGGAQPNISREKIRNLLIPLPPIEEQQRIVDKINEIMPKIDEYEKIEKELETLKKEFPTNMKDALLQAAMQGKLTEQLESDSSVDELLASIQKEKEELIAQKKIKKEKPLPEIQEDEIPFDIPENWKWMRWGNLAYSIQYGYNAPAQEAGKIKMVRISDIQDNSVNWDSVPYCDIPDEEIETYLLMENDILFARTGGTVGKSFLVSNVPEDAIYAGYLIRTRYNNQLIPRYLKLFMESQLYWIQLQNGKTQGCQPNCNGQTLSKMMIPLPPIEEQQRIVERLDALLPLCEDLKEE